jgi:hypothetical protein
MITDGLLAIKNDIPIQEEKVSSRTPQNRIRTFTVGEVCRMRFKTGTGTLTAAESAGINSVRREPESV